MDVPDGEPRTPGYDSLSKQELEQAGSNISTRSSVGSNNIGVLKAVHQFTPSTCNSGVGFNNIDDESGRNTVSSNAISTNTPASGKLSLNSDGVTGASELAQKVSRINLTNEFSESITDSECSDFSQDSMAEDENESSCSSFITNMGIELERITVKGKNIHFRRKDFPRGPSGKTVQKEEELLRELKKEKGITDDNSILKSLEQFKEEYRRTKVNKPTRRSLKQLKKDKPEYADLWQVRFMSKKQVRTKIKRLYERLSEQEKQGHGYRFELEKEREIFFVEELECYVLKGRTTYYCEYDNEQTRNVFLRMDCLLVLIYKILMEDMTVNIRWVQYAFRDIFANTNQVDYVLDYICKGIGCNRDSLNIFASAKGRIAGDISFKGTTRGGKSYATYCQGGVSIEPRDVTDILEFDTLSKEKLLLILVVEKDTIFQRLVEEKFHERFRCIIITGCGMPNVATRTLLRKMQQKLDLPVVALVDHNAGGFNIYLTYLCGSENMAYDSLNLSTPDIKWLGLSPSDLIEHNIPNGNNETVQGLETIKNKDFVKKTQKLVEEVGKMETKVDVEGMMRKHLKYLTEIYLPLKFQRLGMSDSVQARTYR